MLQLISPVLFDFLEYGTRKFQVTSVAHILFLLGNASLGF